MPREIRNVGASVRARLQNLSRETGQSFELILTRYALERLLYRLSISEHAPNLLLGFGPDDVPKLVGVFRSIAIITVDDGVVFDGTSVAGSPIRQDAADGGQGGVRIDLRATLDGARLSLQIDIGFGDAVTPAARSIAYPTLLPDVPAPTLRAYPRPPSSPRSCTP